MGAHAMTPPMEPSSPVDGGIRKRVCKACDRCRLKKSKCDGASPCSRCRADNAICVFGERKKSHDKVYPKGYVEMLESQQAQLVAGLQELYKRSKTGQAWSGALLKESVRGAPLTHDILESLGALKQEGASSPEPFEEDLDALQQKLIAGGAGFMHREPSLDGSSESEHTSSFEHIPRRPPFSNPFPSHHFPPTPPNHSPYPLSANTVASAKPYTFADPISMPIGTSALAWATATPSFDDGMDFITKFESPIEETCMDFSGLSSPLFPDQPHGMAINPCLTMKDWTQQSDLQQYLNVNYVS